MSSYTVKIEALERELVLLERDRESNPAAIRARIASLKKSLQWYTNRLPRPSPSVLGASVADEVLTTSGF